MTKIVTVLRPFIMNQNIFVYEDGNKIDVISAPLDTIENTIIDTAAKYAVKEVQLIGSKKFSKGIKERIETAEMAKYGKNEFEITLIGA